MGQLTIYVRPQYGLCNRLQAIAAGCALAKAEDARLVVLWEVDAGLGCQFEDLFQQSRDFEVISIDRRRSICDKVKFLFWNDVSWLWRIVPTGWIYRTHMRLAFGNAIFQYFRQTDVDELALISALRSRRRILIDSWLSFYGGQAIDFGLFRPHAAEQAEIDRFRESFDAETVGVHIRRTDCVWAIDRSPTEAFVAAMEACIEKQPATRFFLATDCAEVEAEMRARFGNRLMTRPRSLSRETVSGMKDALVDLFLLARTSRILGSFGSTFSTAAAAIGGRELVIVGENVS